MTKGGICYSHWPTILHFKAEEALMQRWMHDHQNIRCMAAGLPNNPCDIGHAGTYGQITIHTLIHTTDYLSYTHIKLFLMPLMTNWPQSRKDFWSVLPHLFCTMNRFKGFSDWCYLSNISCLLFLFILDSPQPKCDRPKTVKNQFVTLEYCRGYLFDFCLRYCCF